jgi:hypothetical protein
VVAFSMPPKDSSRRKPSWEGCCRARLSSRLLIFLMPRKAEDMYSEGDLSDGDRLFRGSAESKSENRLKEPEDGWPESPNVSPEPDILSSMGLSRPSTALLPWDDSNEMPRRSEKRLTLTRRLDHSRETILL